MGATLEVLWQVGWGRRSGKRCKRVDRVAKCRAGTSHKFIASSMYSDCSRHQGVKAGCGWEL